MQSILQKTTLIENDNNYNNGGIKSRACRLAGSIDKSFNPGN